MRSSRSIAAAIAGALAVTLGVFAYRTVRTSADGTKPAAEIVRLAWTDGRRVPLRGLQLVTVPEAGNEPVQASVVTSGEGDLRIEYLTPPLRGAKVWDDGERTYRYNPKRERLTVALRRGSGEDVDNQLLQNYDAKIVGREQVAGRRTIALELRPRSRSGRWTRIWVDPETWVILAQEDLRGEDQLLRRTRFTKVEYLKPGEQPAPSEFTPPRELIEKYGTARPGDTADRFTPEQLSRQLGFQVRVPKQLPRGYTFQGAYPTPCPTKGSHQAARLEFSDGLNTLTLFECGESGCPATDNGFETNGDAALAYSKAINGVGYLAVGDAPVEDLKRLVESAAR